jgi:hypothetical protein
MANTLQQKPSRRTRRVTTKVFKGTLTGSYVQATGTAGEVLNVTTATDPNFYAEPVAGLFDNAAHVAGLFEAKLVRPPAGYTGELVKKTTPAGWQDAYILKLYSAPGTELAAAAYPAAILADTFEFEITGPNGTL